MKVAGLSSGTLYPRLARLTEDGWLESRWEESGLPGKPRRQMYRLTASGRVQAKQAMARARASWLRLPQTREA
jgi:DNA-binding PadR family transcriptional regulator